MISERTSEGLIVPKGTIEKPREMLAKEDVRVLRRAMKIADVRGIKLGLVCEACSAAKRQGLMIPVEDASQAGLVMECGCRKMVWEGFHLG